MPICENPNCAKEFSGYSKERKRDYSDSSGPKQKKYCSSRCVKYVWKKRNPNQHLKDHLKKKFGMTLEQYNNLLEKQNNRCAICDTFCEVHERLSVDHCHETGRVRGLLCFHCNSGIGKLKDDSKLLRQAADYLDGYV